MIYYDPKITPLLWGFVSSGLLIYFMISMVTYFKSKQKMYLYYGLYNFMVFIYLFKTQFLFPIDEINAFLKGRYGGLTLTFQIVYNSFLFLFYSEFLEIKKYYPNQIRVLNKLLVVANVVSILFFAYSIIFNDLQSFTYFAYIVFVPFFTFFIFYAMYISFKVPNELRYFIVFGVLFYQTCAYTNVYFTIFNKGIIGEPDPMSYLYIGLLFDSLLFMVAIGFKVKRVFLEKINAQRIVIEEQKEIQLLKEKYNKELELELAKRIKKLKNTLQKIEDEKFKSVKYTFENEVSNLKLDSLRSQMNPHFIFNALNSIKAYLIENDTQKAVYYLNKFSKLIRKILESSRSESIPLDEEVVILELYMNIENIRFEQKIDFAINIDSSIDLTKIKIPGLLFQPFIENALWHGLMLKQGERKIDVAIYQEVETVKLSIVDNGIGREKAQFNKNKKSFKRDSLGLQFAKERFDYFNRRENTNYNFKIIDLYDDNKIATGTRVEFEFRN